MERCKIWLAEISKYLSSLDKMSCDSLELAQCSSPVAVFSGSFGGWYIVYCYHCFGWIIETLSWTETLHDVSIWCLYKVLHLTSISPQHQNPNLCDLLTLTTFCIGRFGLLEWKECSLQILWNSRRWGFANSFIWGKQNTRNSKQTQGFGCSVSPIKSPAVI